MPFYIVYIDLYEKVILSFSEFLNEKVSATLIDNNENGMTTKGTDIFADARSRSGSVPFTNIPIHKLNFNEDIAAKMKTPQSIQTVDNLVKSIKQGNAHTIPKISITEKNKDGNHTVIDGHHRVMAFKLAGVKTIPAQIISNKNISYSGNNYEKI